MEQTKERVMRDEITEAFRSTTIHSPQDHGRDIIFYSIRDEKTLEGSE